MPHGRCACQVWVHIVGTASESRYPVIAAMFHVELEKPEAGLLVSVARRGTRCGPHFGMSPSVAVNGETRLPTIAGSDMSPHMGLRVAELGPSAVPSSRMPGPVHVFGVALTSRRGSPGTTCGTKARRKPRLLPSMESVSRETVRFERVGNHGAHRPAVREPRATCVSREEFNTHWGVGARTETHGAQPPISAAGAPPYAPGALLRTLAGNPGLLAAPAGNICRDGSGGWGAVSRETTVANRNEHGCRTMWIGVARTASLVQGSRRIAVPLLRDPHRDQVRRRMHGGGSGTADTDPDTARRRAIKGWPRSYPPRGIYTRH